MNNHLKNLASILLFAFLVIFSFPSKAGFFDQMVDSVKRAAEDTLDEVMNQPDDQNNDNQPQRNTRQTTESSTRTTKQPTTATPRQVKPTYDRELVLQIQKRLNVLGINAGTPD